MFRRVSVVLSESRSGDPDGRRLAEVLVGALMSRRRIDLTVIPHLYDLETDGPTIQFLREIEGPMIVISWLHPRAAFWTLKTAGVRGRMGNGRVEPNDGERSVWCLGIQSDLDPTSVLEEVDRIIAADSLDRLEPATELLAPNRRWEETRDRWYPVIDRDRCSGCLECLNFCLFGVYGVDAADDILIEQPNACRAGCPACSRICPEGAIMFPQHADPAISGDPEASLHGLKLDLSQLFSGANPGALALAEREHALSQTEKFPKTAGADRLDDLVDKLDDMDI